MTFLGYKPSTLLLWVVLSLPALTMIGPLLGDDARAFHRLLHPTGEWAARLMIIGMMASGLMLVFRGRQWPRWLMHHRRDIEDRHRSSGAVPSVTTTRIQGGTG